MLSMPRLSSVLFMSHPMASERLIGNDADDLIF